MRNKSSGQLIVGCNVIGAPRTNDENKPPDFPGSDRVRSGPLSSLSRNVSRDLSFSAEVPTLLLSQAKWRSVSRMTEEEEVGLERTILLLSTLCSSCSRPRVWSARRVRK